MKFEYSELFAGQGPKPTQVSTKASSANPTAQKPAAYRPPHAKTAAAIQAEVHIHRTNDLLIVSIQNYQYKLQQ